MTHSFPTRRSSELLRSGQYRLGGGVRGFQTPQGVCVDLGDMILALDLAVRIDRKLRRASGWVLDERRTLTIDRDAATVRAGTETHRIGPSDIRDTAAGWCVDLERSEEHTSLQSLMRISYAVFCLKKKNKSTLQLLLRTSSNDLFIPNTK